MARVSLRVAIAGREVGTLWQDEAGRAFFRYDEEYGGVPLSLSMPLSNRIYDQRVVRPFLFGLLPDDERQRRAIAYDYDISPNNPVAMLACIGLDCPGAVQFYPAEEGEGVAVRHGALRPLTDHEVALRLKSIARGPGSSWMGLEESWSLGGNQGKFALALEHGAWCECRGSAPTTHILKNGVSGFELQALNEFVCMRTAGMCGIPVAHLDYCLFEDEPALVVERYDRVRDASGQVVRIHQEDFCQALSVMPNQKYGSDGGPSMADALLLLAKTRDAEVNLRYFTQMVFYNCLIGAPDGHAKNYSLLLGNEGIALLAPMYDVASGLAYEHMRRKGRLAMAIGGENRFGRVGGGALERYAQGGGDRVGRAMEQAGLDAVGCRELMANLAQRVPAAMEQVFEVESALPGMDELRAHLLGPVSDNCARTLGLL